MLAKDLFCTETLARVDVICLDKTGTLTEGSMQISDVIELAENKSEIEKALCALTSSLEDSNPTFNAIKEKFNVPSDLTATVTVPFSSDKKWSGASFSNGVTYIIGAPEIILKSNTEKLKDKLAKYSSHHRVVLLAKSGEIMKNGRLPKITVPIALLLVNDIIRKQANKTLAYFYENGVRPIVISGDNPKTVSAISREAGIKEYEQAIDAGQLDTYEKIKEASRKYTIFGRVSPSQKRDIIKALKEDGHTVAMTGDGVNDVLALKEADCSFAMAEGSEAARNVSQLVLLDSNFEAMPEVVAEGRRSINNIERSASLFLVKTIFSSILSIIFIFIEFKYPFESIQMSLIGVFTIGLPSFVLAIEPNKKKISGAFFRNIIKKSLPCAAAITSSIVFLTILGYIFSMSNEVMSTIAVISTTFFGLSLVYRLSLPLNKIRTAMLTISTLGITVGLLFFRDLFSVAALSVRDILLLLALTFAGTLIFDILYSAMNKSGAAKAPTPD